MKGRSDIFIPALQLSSNHQETVEPPRQVTIDLPDFEKVAASCSSQLFKTPSLRDENKNTHLINASNKKSLPI